MIIKRNPKAQKGMTLIEIMVVLVILAIIAGIGYPSYLDGLRKARRSDARIVALDVAALQEKWYFQHNTFTDDITKLVDPAESPEGHYTVELQDPTPCGDNSCYVIEVTPTGDQADDTECALFTVSHTGRKEAEDSGGNDTTERCWGS